VGVVFSGVRPSRGFLALVEGARHLDVQVGEALGQARLHERLGLVGVGELDVLEIGLADALAEDAPGLGIGEVAARLAQLPMWVGVFEASAGENLNDFAGRIVESRK
jgi:hypothetical protein